MENGIITKGISSFYYVKISNGKVIECKARGRFRNTGITPIVGDNVTVELLDEEHGTIVEIMPRKTMLIRPLVANVDQAIVVFSLKKPDLNFTLLDKLLILIEHNKLDAIICLNKSDLDDDDTFNNVASIYGNIGYRVIKFNGLTGEGMDELNNHIQGKISVFAGPSGVGKSTISNKLQSKIKMETGEISQKISRGKHTTRHAELIEVNKDSYIVDTPGFSSIDLTFIQPEELQYVFKEFNQFIGECKFTSCLHHKENICEIKDQVGKGIIPVQRYNAYVDILQELQQTRRKFR
jgi:ribosome biogenesis GTPase / thiamine phosphate phosphatase